MRNKLHTKIIFAVLACLAVGAIGSLVTSGAISGWYATLEKPVFNPPNWVFAPVWTLLYVLMGIATGIVWFKKEKFPFAKIALRFFSIQLVLNLCWSFAFFYFESPLLGLINILILLICIVITLKWYARVDTLAAKLLYPYLAWVCFATVLNFNLWVLN